MYGEERPDHHGLHVGFEDRLRDARLLEEPLVVVLSKARR
jgi:hypothetical protein